MASYEANRERWNAYLREYRRKKREAKKKAASDGANIESGRGNIDSAIVARNGGKINESY